jgi:membrane protease subunit HflC
VAVPAALAAIRCACLDRCGSRCFFTVDSADYAIVTDSASRRRITTPGFGSASLQSVRMFDRRLFVYAAPPSEFLTLEKTPVVASGTILVAGKQSEAVF